MRRPVKVGLWTLGVLLGVPLLLVLVVLVGANIQPGRDLIERMVPKLTGGDVTLEGLAGRFPGALRAERIRVRDPKGTWLVIERLALNWTPLRLLIGEARIDRLAAARIELTRLPESASQSSSSSSGLPVAVTLGSLDVASFDLGAAVAGTEAAFSIAGHARLTALDRGDVLLDIQGANGVGTYRLEGRFDPQTLDAQLTADEPANGPVARLAGLTDVGAIALHAFLKGPRSAVATELSLHAGPLAAEAKGELDFVDQAADLGVTASAPAMSPRPDVSWHSVSLNATVSGPFAKPAARGTLRIEGLDAGGAGVNAIAADVQGDQGRVELKATLDGLRIPGDRPDAFAGEPLVIGADARLDAPDRPVTFTVQHPLLAAKGRARTAGEIRAAVSLTLPDLAPLAAAGGADVQGHAELELRAAEQGGTTTLDADGAVSVIGGAPPLPGLLGDSAKLSASASLRGQDLTLSRLQVDGKTIQVTANGGLIAKAVTLDWKVALSDMAVLSPNVSGALKATGRVSGKTDDFSVRADLSGEVATQDLPRAPITAHLEAQGLPKTPSGEIKAQGALAGSPLELAIFLRQSSGGATHVDIKRADWKSAHAEGQLSLAQGAVFPVGTMELRMTRLEDLRPLIGQPVTGSFTANLVTTQQGGGVARARVSADARGVGLPNTGAVDHLTLAATVVNPVASPVVDATLVVDGLSAKGVAGSGRVEVKGPADALALQVAADARNLAGSPARLAASAVLDATGKKVAVSALQANWKGETLRLLSPVRVDFADGLGVDRLRVGLQQAVVDVSGRVSPTLDLTAEVRDVTPALVTPFVPDLKADGKLRAEARLTGTPARPTGKVRLEATGLRMRSGPASSLPAATLTATLDLAGDTARVNSRLTVGPRTNLAVTGQVPITSAGRMNLSAKGAVDLLLADPILAAGGRRVRGQLQIDAAATGTLAQPRLGGSVQLARGELQDFGQGIHLKDIDALLQLDGDTLRVARLTSRAGTGTVSVSGTVGVLAPDIPIDLRIDARDAQPLSSDLLTVNLNAGLAVTGQAARQLLAAGNVRINKAEIRIPETLPTSVATLNVRRPGEKPPPPAAPGPVINLDLTIEAPSQIFVRGRGLDAELAGRVRVQGTADNPQPIGSFQLRRGQFTLAGQTLTFTKGKVSFNGGSLVDPSLDFTVSSTNGNVTAELNIGGTVSDPKITLSSTPELPQDEVLSQLLFGRSASSLSAFELAQIASALAELTGVTSGGVNPLSAIRTGLGLDQLSVGTDSGGKPTLEAGRYVTPNVYVGVEQGASASSTKAKVQVDLTRRLKLEATVGASSGSATGSSDQGASSVGVTYQFEY
jgi:translocation and assembly module TamB